MFVAMASLPLIGFGWLVVWLFVCLFVFSVVCFLLSLFKLGFCVMILFAICKIKKKKRKKNNLHCTNSALLLFFLSHYY